MKLLYAAAGCIIVAIALNLAAIDWSSQATTRADIAAQAEVSVAELQAQAAMHTADAQAQAAMHAADAATQRTAIVAGVLPVVLLLVISGGVLLMAVWYRGRAHVLRTQAMLLDGGRPVALPQPPPQVLALAQERGARPALVDGQWHLLVDGQVVARVRQLPGPGARR